ncbi:hypothetical protein GUJ93_ZPchr0006g42650 [Zizania palustris]|uniref:Uncharacterized protein n=1 Tax=Zizania palustris TaxID=103762 RepID=A0A8J5SH57_ZIZPA|nr:hypothetical protein GUJ93_ZPchr0006g42650 [Zizania palustris]
MQFHLFGYANDIHLTLFEVVLLHSANVFKKCVKLPVLAHHLIKYCGLLSWLSSVISSHGEGLDSVKDTYSSTVIGSAPEVVNYLTSSRLFAEYNGSKKLPLSNSRKYLNLLMSLLKI